MSSALASKAVEFLSADAAGSEDAAVSVKLEWEPFLLNPNMPDEGEDIMDHLTNKYGPSAKRRFGDPNSYLMRAGREVGIEFTNKRKVYPTVRAHALMEHVKEEYGNDKANQIMEEMYKRYFCQGENINSVDKLSEIAAQFEIPKDQVVQACSSYDMVQQVQQKDAKYKRSISGVPFFIIHRNDGGRPLGISGAQPPDLLAEQLEEAAQEK